MNTAAHDPSYHQSSPAKEDMNRTTQDVWGLSEPIRKPAEPQGLSQRPFFPTPFSGGDSDWGLLAKKQDPRKASGEDFWATMSNHAPPEAGETQEKRESDEPPSSEPSLQGQQITELEGPGSQGIESPQNAEQQETNDLQTSSEEKGPAPEPAPIELSPEEIAAIEERRIQRELKRRGRVKQVDVEEPEYEPEEARKGKRKSHSRRNTRSQYDDDDGEFDYEEYEEKRRAKKQRKAAQREARRAAPKSIILPELIGITGLADALNVERNVFLAQLGELGFEGVTLDSLMPEETAALVAQEYGFEPIVGTESRRDLKPRPPPEDPSVLPLRPPVVTIMGHVDHGKTTLLDYLRKSSVAAQEHGGITQRIGAFSVKLSSGKPITFLDTPGHAAFLTMRQRGAYVTDIVVLVVAADDSVKPQTIEAIKHAHSARVPIIVAINKIDKDGARIDQVKSDLAREGVEIEEYGGDVQVVCVSGKTGQGMDDLEESILTLSEILDYRAEVDGAAEGWVLESSLKPIGKAATVLVKRGTLRPGDFVVAGVVYAKIRHLRNEAGAIIKEAPPGTPVEISGWKELPAAGDEVIQASNEGRAKDVVDYRAGLRDLQKDAAAHEIITASRQALQEKRAREKAAAEAEEDGADTEDKPDKEEEKEPSTKIVNFVVKGDLHGSVEAVCAAVLEIGNQEVQARVLRSATGPITEFDVEHAATSDSVIINFATTTPAQVQRLAKDKGVKILNHNVIYHLIDDVKLIMSQYLAPSITSRALGEAEVLQIFPINTHGRRYKNVAGCRVRDGTLSKNDLYRVVRKGQTVHTGKIETLKHVKDDITEARSGSECGVGFQDFQDFEVGDTIQAYEEIKTERSL
ncbi:initiation factor 2 [Durotheca rogersii]|uniref:initiation factor 2 n=1 Tax=Durotheca rogersii TaxID=419775 RepID=UPI00221FA072|nr:initiation factor 2 [Durotheca rogersii]KAI5859954.1 initiation factor 2 [Durotheca rogersii]